MISTIFEILATIVACATGSAGGVLLAVGIGERSAPLILGSLSFMPIGIAAGYGVEQLGRLLAWGLGL